MYLVEDYARDLSHPTRIPKENFSIAFYSTSRFEANLELYELYIFLQQIWQ